MALQDAASWAGCLAMSSQAKPAPQLGLAATVPDTTGLRWTTVNTPSPTAILAWTHGLEVPPPSTSQVTVGEQLDVFQERNSSEIRHHNGHCDPRKSLGLSVPVSLSVKW